MSDIFDHYWDAHEDLLMNGPDPLAPTYMTAPTTKVVNITEVLYETDKAKLFSDGEYKFWIPKSLINRETNNKLRLPKFVTINYTSLGG